MSFSLSVILKSFIAVLLLSFCSCWSDQNTGGKISTHTKTRSSFPIKPMIITGEHESWGADVRLSFTEVLANDSTTMYNVSSTYEGKNVGFIIIVPQKSMSKLTLKSKGESSNNFLHVLQKIYKQKIDSAKFVDSVTADCLNLSDLNQPWEKDVVLAAQRKLFFQGSNEDDYAELFLNIDEKEHWIEFVEKDSEYRPLIIKFLSH